MIIDCHGHYTTAPKALENWRNAQIAGIKDPTAMPKAADLKISDDELRESIETNQLRLMNERGSDITLFSPRASFHGPPHWRLQGVQHLGGHLQRAVLPRLHAVPRQLCACGHAAAKPRCGPGHLHP
jgi:hypothetical protein